MHALENFFTFCPSSSTPTPTPCRTTPSPCAASSIPSPPEGFIFGSANCLYLYLYLYNILILIRKVSSLDLPTAAQRSQTVEKIIIWSGRFCSLKKNIIGLKVILLLFSFIDDPDMRKQLREEFGCNSGKNKISLFLLNLEQNHPPKMPLFRSFVPFFVFLFCDITSHSIHNASTLTVTQHFEKLLLLPDSTKVAFTWRILILRGGRSALKRTGCMKPCASQVFYVLLSP